MLTDPAQIHHSAPAAAPAPAVSIQESLRHAGLEVLLPSDEAYSTRQESYFSKTASRLVPACIIRPRSALDVSSAIRILSSGEGHRFAVRSGGHAPNVGASNIDGGITLDLGLLNWTRVVTSTQSSSNINIEQNGESSASSNDEVLVDIGPGDRWANVYSKLHQLGLAVPGGREGGVGVGGLILGGGNTYFTASHGFACDNVVAFEVVLAPDGRIVTASADENSDLFWALKGGGNNLGVVTNFRMRALPGQNNIWGGLTIMPWDIKDLAADALVEFTERVHEDVDANLMLFYIYQPHMAKLGIIAVYAHVGAVANAPAYEKLMSLPASHTDVKMTSLADLVAYNKLPLGFHSIWFTATFKNDARIASHAAALHEQLVTKITTEIAPDGDFWAMCLFQPLPRICTKPRDNALGLPSEHDALLVQTSVMVRTPEQEALAYPLCKAYLEAVRKFAAKPEIDGYLDWEYINYADASQDPLRSYGKANVDRLKAVARKYDPQQVFQKLCMGGFKIGDVDLYYAGRNVNNEG
ncbi:hypothetical protein QBC37DRAFT_421736 [Rhypophila decipiens]|uniref:FAD-binding PCMH-type domain-containing protein n=1 Tax=Rhypophila decipiens TaxID=261697 RepID=A0AAN7B8M4_9PEZI|nr:hypothetical protein QBC37DRAFT_421736 [Rhypophila decipiens]